MDTRFHCVYLLTSLDPICQGEYYIGYTVDPVRRLRQHNGELVNGARRTSRRGRPWTMVCCVSGFVEDRAALKFEWCWQHPQESARIKHLPQFTALFARPGKFHRVIARRDISFAVAILHLLLRATLFNRLDLTLHVLDAARFQCAVSEAQTRIGIVHRTSKLRMGGDDHEHRTHTTGSRCDAEETVSQSSPHMALEEETRLPSLTESDLLHMEEISLREFEKKYLANDRCLTMSETRAAWSQSPYTPTMSLSATENDALSASWQEQSGLARGACHEADRSALDALACVYDMKALSQSVREEWPEAEAHAQTGCTGSSSSAVRWEESMSCARRNEASECDVPVGDAHDLLPGAHDMAEKEDEEADDEEELTLVGGATQLGSSSYLVHQQPPPPTRSLSPVPLLTPGAHASAASPSSTSPPRQARHRIPLRFRYYTERDYAHLHQLECQLMRQRLLPCTLCGLPLQAPYIMRCPREPHCSLRTHIVCLAMWFHYEHDMTQYDAGVGVCAGGGAAVDDVRGDRTEHDTNDDEADDEDEDSSSSSSSRTRSNSRSSTSDMDGSHRPPCRSESVCSGVPQGTSCRHTETNETVMLSRSKARDDGDKGRSAAAADDANRHRGCDGSAFTEPPASTASLALPPVPQVDLIPSHPCPCPLCDEKLLWPCLVRALKQRVGKERRAQAVERRARMEQRCQQRMQNLVAHSPASPKRAKRRRENDDDAVDASTAPAKEGSAAAGGSASPMTRRQQRTTWRQRGDAEGDGAADRREHTALSLLDEGSQTVSLAPCASAVCRNESANIRAVRSDRHAASPVSAGGGLPNACIHTNSSFTLPPPGSNHDNSTTMLLGLTEFNEEEWLNV